MGVGAIIWMWMVLVRWKKSKVIIETPDGNKEF
jgi:APA family basic amino acid/polyamine antiporter